MFKIAIRNAFNGLILSALHPATHHADRISNYIQYADELDFTGIEFPVQMKDISRFETQNDITINVFGYERGNIYPIHLTRKRFMRHVDLWQSCSSQTQIPCATIFLQKICTMIWSKTKTSSTLATTHQIIFYMIQPIKKSSEK